MRGILEQLKLLAFIALILLEIGVTVGYTNHVVRFKSGLNSNDTLRRMWSKADQIVFQPVSLALPLGLMLLIGTFSNTRSLILGSLKAIGVDSSPTTDLAVSVVAVSPGTLAGMTTYLLNGGIHTFSGIFGSFVLLEGWTVWHLLSSDHPTPVVMIILWMVSVGGVAAIVSAWTVKHVSSRVSATIAAPGPFPVLVWTLASVLLVALRFIDVFCVAYARSRYQENGPLHYFGGVFAECAGIMVLIGCAFSGILVTNHSIMSGAYNWQWRALLAPTCLLIAEAVVKVLGVGSFIEQESVVRRIGTWVMRCSAYLAAGYLGAAVYLAVITMAARKALSMDDTTDLILDDDDDEDAVEIFEV